MPLSWPSTLSTGADMYRLFIVEYNGADGAYVPYTHWETDSLNDAVQEAEAMKRISGRCYAVFYGDSSAPCHETSRYYAAHKLPRRNASARGSIQFDVV